MNNFSGKTILVAEDDEDSRVMLRVFLENKGYHVIEAGNGLEAIKKAQIENPDLILMDLNLPELNGIDATRQIRQNDNLSDVPIIANSADGNFGINFFLNLNNFDRGFISYLTKPLNLDELSEQIEAALLLPRLQAR